METIYRVYYSPSESGKGNPWVDMPESVPHVRARLKDDVEVDEAEVTVAADGTLTYNEDIIEITGYPTE
jgi:hypothetical protein